MARTWAWLACLLVGTAWAGEIQSLEDLRCLTRCELDTLYRNASAGAIPCGPSRGIVLHGCDQRLAGPRSAMAESLWKGKDFDPGAGELTNQWLGFRGVKASLEPGISLLDGQPTIVMDYRGRSAVVWRRVRDELREVGPGIYLGVMVVPKRCDATVRMYFALDFSSTCADDCSCATISADPAPSP